MLNAEGTNEQTTLQAGSTSETEATGEQEASGEGANDAERRNVAVRQLETSFDLSAVGAGSREAAAGRLLNRELKPRPTLQR